MATLRHFKPSLQNFAKDPTLIFFSLMVFFWSLFDASMSYITPLLISNAGFSNTAVGIIYGSSSIAGAFFDFAICKFFKDTKYRRLFLIMLIVCLLYPLILGNAKTAWTFVFAMAIWGFYFDLYGFGLFNFISSNKPKEDQAASFGTVQIFRSFGAILAPLIVSAILVGTFFFNVLVVAELLLLVAFIFYFMLIIKTKNTIPLISQVPRTKKSFINELQIWKKLGTKLLPCLIVTFYLFAIEAFFWTLAPLYAKLQHLGGFGGLFIAAYSVPILISGSLVGNAAKKFGGKKLAFISLTTGGLILTGFMLSTNPIIHILIVFCAAFFFGMALPAINATYTEQIVNSSAVEGEIEALEDFSLNIGYVIGPIAAGFLSDALSIPGAFTLLGALGFIIGLSLLALNKKKLNITEIDTDYISTKS